MCWSGSCVACIVCQVLVFVILSLTLCVKCWSVILSPLDCVSCLGLCSYVSNTVSQELVCLLVSFTLYVMCWPVFMCLLHHV